MVLSCGAFYYVIQGGSNFFNLWMKSLSVTIQMKATAQYFPVVLFMMLYKLVPTFESMDELIKYNHSIKSSLAVLFGSTFRLETIIN